MKILIILNKNPYDGTDVTWNALRLVDTALGQGMGVRVFLMNDAVDLAREGLEKGVDYDLQGMLIDAISKGAEAKLCKTCITRCGIGMGNLKSEIAIGTMPELVEWVADSDRVLTF
ncbi:MAG: DsrE family protein [bacterium]